LLGLKTSIPKCLTLSSSLFDGFAETISISVYMLSESMDNIYASISRAILIARALFPEAVGPIIANCLKMLSSSL